MTNSNIGTASEPPEDQTTPHLPHIRRAPAAALLLLNILGLSACQEQPTPTNAAEDARISRGMEDVATGQAQSEADVAVIETERRRAAKERQVKASRGAE